MTEKQEIQEEYLDLKMKMDMLLINDKAGDLRLCEIFDHHLGDGIGNDKESFDDVVDNIVALPLIFTQDDLKFSMSYAMDVKGFIPPVWFQARLGELTSSSYDVFEGKI